MYDEILEKMIENYFLAAYASLAVSNLSIYRLVSTKKVYKGN